MDVTEYIIFFPRVVRIRDSELVWLYIQKVISDFKNTNWFKTILFVCLKPENTF